MSLILLQSLFDVRTGTLPVAAAGLLDSDGLHVVTACWGLHFVTADFVILYRHCSTGVTQDGVATVRQQPRLTGL